MKGGFFHMKIMTFNLRFENDHDGENGWPYRRDLVVRTILRHAPFILGTQEGIQRQLGYLRDRLEAYELYLPARRVLDERSQCPTLLYRRDELELLEGDELWLSKTPEKHLSKDWDSAFPRMIGYALLRHRKTGRELWAGVTHLDHMGTEARFQQARLAGRWVKERRRPVILMGDFNDAPDSPAYRELVGEETGLTDTWRALGYGEDESSMTSHDFHGVPRKARLDWILAGDAFAVRRAAVLRDHEGSRYPSDHFPYVAELEWA